MLKPLSVYFISNCRISTSVSSIVVCPVVMIYHHASLGQVAHVLYKICSGQCPAKVQALKVFYAQRKLQVTI